MVSRLGRGLAHFDTPRLKQCSNTQRDAESFLKQTHDSSNYGDTGVETVSTFGISSAAVPNGGLDQVSASA